MKPVHGHSYVARTEIAGYITGVRNAWESARALHDREEVAASNGSIFVRKTSCMCLAGSAAKAGGQLLNCLGLPQGMTQPALASHAVHECSVTEIYTPW